MIDFRYHLVSLISVFLALAVGIALGAGPLKESIGDTLTGQVDQLRVEKDALRGDLDRTSTELAHTEAAMAAMAPTVLSGVLGQRRVAVVQLGEVETEVLEGVVTRIGQAGGSVTATVQVTEAWTDPEQRSFRSSLAGTLVDYLEPVPPAEAGTEVELAEALVQALTTAAPTDPDVLAEDAAVVLELLGGEAGLVAVEGEVTVPADAVVVLSGPTVSAADADMAAVAAAEAEEGSDETAAAAQELAEARLTTASAIATAAQTRSAGAVVAAGGLVPGSLTERLREDTTSGARPSTVESVQTLTGQISVPLALAARIGGTVGHYGPSEGAEAVLPPHIVLPVVERVVPVPPVEPVPDPGVAPVEPVEPVEPTE